MPEVVTCLPTCFGVPYLVVFFLLCFLRLAHFSLLLQLQLVISDPERHKTNATHKQHKTTQTKGGLTNQTHKHEVDRHMHSFIMLLLSVRFLLSCSCRLLVVSLLSESLLNRIDPNNQNNQRIPTAPTVPIVRSQVRGERCRHTLMV